VLKKANRRFGTGGIEALPPGISAANPCIFSRINFVVLNQQTEGLVLVGLKPPPWGSAQLIPAYFQE
jgi:hypothetical protein